MKSTNPVHELPAWSINLENAVEKNFHRKDAKTQRKIKILKKRLICVFTKQVSIVFAVSPLRSWRLCGKLVLNYVFKDQSSKALGESAQGVHH
jgi:hypothetical protein